MERRRYAGSKTSDGPKGQSSSVPEGRACEGEESPRATDARRLAAVVPAWARAFWALYVAAAAGFVTFLLLRYA